MIRWCVCSDCHKKFTVVARFKPKGCCPFCHGKNISFTGRVVS